MACKEIDLCITKADEKAYNLTFSTGKSKTPLDITGSTVYMTVKNDPADDDTNAVFQKKVTNHDDPTNGKTTVSLTSNDTDKDVGNYYYDFQISGGSITKQTIQKGRFEITWQSTDK